MRRTPMGSNRVTDTRSFFKTKSRCLRPTLLHPRPTLRFAISKKKTPKIRRCAPPPGAPTLRSTAPGLLLRAPPHRHGHARPCRPRRAPPQGERHPVKRQRTAAGTAPRPPLSTASQNAAAPPPTEAPIEFAGREDVDALLNEKIKGKNKMDYKGRSEQMIEYIKKLRACIKWLLEREDANLAEIGKLNGLIDAADKHHAEIGLQKQYATLGESLKKVEAEQMKEARIAAESSRNELSEELNRVKLEQKRLNDQNAETIEKLQKEKNTMVETMNGLKDHSNSLKLQLDMTKSSQNEALKQKNNLLNEVEALRGELQQVRDDRDHKSAEINSLLSDLGAFKELTGKSSTELENVMIRCDVLEETCSNQNEQIKTLQIQLASANEKLKRSNLTTMETMSEYENQKRMLEDLQLRLTEAEQKIVDGEKLRKKLHNTILELKGNIRVFCRVRPLLSNESGAVSYPNNGENIGRGVELMHNTQAYSFAFDKVFDHSASQEDVFTEISQLVQSALDGYKVCIFAYGQTGSGKTHTMMGNPEFNDQKGLIPRSLEQIFETSQSLMSQGWKYKMQASMLEIYNETIVSDLTIVDVRSINEVSSLLKRAAQSRSVGKTQMNEESSRSHCVFTLRIFGVNEGTDQQVQGVLNLIDLAGSERLNKSGVTGDRLKETQAINKSLSSLSDVIFSIAKKEEHIPFRNSKLTYLLQPCLGGDSKTLMFVNLSPEVSSTSESICSLRFAARVNSCEIGVPRRQTQMRSLSQG
ncbi:hypothetical protein ZWY2020_056249 [Hordeum vulgare]|nr:hypothetical protein ZWY2020_056249 [Hordeum vulgare]